jgi:putative N6-adenine-specific DNA methylase
MNDSVFYTAHGTNNQYFATVARGLEAIAAEELTELGAKQVKAGFCGVEFTGDLGLLYYVNLWARLPFRILVKLHQFPCGNAQELYHGIKSIDWSAYLNPSLTLSVNATGKSEFLNHTHFTALQVKNAIVDQQLADFGERSNVDPKDADLQIGVHIADDICTVSLDSSGNSLHRRGYRAAVGAAPLKESLAAALIRLSGWEPEQVFYDPLCGSGTLPLEASLKALNIAPGLFRERFGFESWLDCDQMLLDKLMAEAERSQKQNLPAAIWGSDHNDAVIAQATANARKCGVANHVHFEILELSEVEPPATTGVLFCNPPYGERLGQNTDLREFYRELGNVLKQRFKGWTAFILSGNKELSQCIGLKSAQRTAVYNGTLPCQLMKYELY